MRLSGISPLSECPNSKNKLRIVSASAPQSSINCASKHWETKTTGQFNSFRDAMPMFIRWGSGHSTHAAPSMFAS